MYNSQLKNTLAILKVGESAYVGPYSGASSIYTMIAKYKEAGIAPEGSSYSVKRIYGMDTRGLEIHRDIYEITRKE